jgi:hypothetical protein
MANAELPPERPMSSIEKYLLAERDIRAQQEAKKVFWNTIKGHTIGLFADYEDITEVILAGEQSAIILGGRVTSTADYPGKSLDIALISSGADRYQTTAVILGKETYKISAEGRVTFPKINNMEMTNSGLMTLSSLMGQRAPEADYNRARTLEAAEAWRQSQQAS